MSPQRRRIAVVSSSRADYGHLYYVLKGLQAAVDVELLPVQALSPSVRKSRNTKVAVRLSRLIINSPGNDMARGRLQDGRT